MCVCAVSDEKRPPAARFPIVWPPRPVVKSFPRARDELASECPAVCLCIHGCAFAATLEELEHMIPCHQNTTTSRGVAYFWCILIAHSFGGCFWVVAPFLVFAVVTLRQVRFPPYSLAYPYQKGGTCPHSSRLCPAFVEMVHNTSKNQPYRWRHAMGFLIFVFMWVCVCLVCLHWRPA